MNPIRQLVTATAVCVATVGLLVLACGCSRFQAASVPSNQATPLVLNSASRDVLLNASDKDIQVLASALESQAESGSVIYIDYQGWLRNPDGTVYSDKNGEPVRVRSKTIAKLNSLKELANMTGVRKASYRVGAYGYAKDLPAGMQGKDLPPEALVLEVEGVDALQATDTTAANRKAAADERKAILDAMANLAEKQGAAFATRVKAIGEATVNITTVAGKEVVARVLGTYPIEAGIAGVTKAVQAVVESKADGKTQAVLAEGDNATALEKAAKEGRAP